MGCRPCHGGGIHGKYRCEMPARVLAHRKCSGNTTYSPYYHCYLFMGQGDTGEFRSDAETSPGGWLGARPAEGAEGDATTSPACASNGSGQAQPLAAPCTPHTKLPPPLQQTRSLCLSHSGPHQDPCPVCSDAFLSPIFQSPVEATSSRRSS